MDDRRARHSQYHLVALVYSKALSLNNTFILVQVSIFLITVKLFRGQEKRVLVRLSSSRLQDRARRKRRRRILTGEKTGEDTKTQWQDLPDCMLFWDS